MSEHWSSFVGYCVICEHPLSKVWFDEPEYKNHRPTGRYRRAVSHFLCENCGHKEAVDDTFDGPWAFRG